MTRQEAYDTYARGVAVFYFDGTRKIKGKIKRIDTDIPHFPVTFMGDAGFSLLCALEDIDCVDPVEEEK